MEEQSAREMCECFLQACDSHLVPVKGAVVVHDVHGAAVEEISQSSHFVGCD